MYKWGIAYTKRGCYINGMISVNATVPKIFCSKIQFKLQFKIQFYNLEILNTVWRHVIFCRSNKYHA